MPRGAKTRATVPDLVVLSLLAERPMYGDEVARELIKREVKDWAGISRPQVYYSLRKLHKSGHLEMVRSEPTEVGPRRQVYALTQSGQACLADALQRESWATQRTLPPFLTWLALSPHGHPHTFETMVKRRREYLRSQRQRELDTFESLRAATGPMARPARLMVKLTIRSFELELDWLDEVEERLGSPHG